MKTNIECAKFKTYLQTLMPNAFDDEGLLDTHNHAILTLKVIDIDGVGVTSIKEIIYFNNLTHLNVENNPNLTHLPKLPKGVRSFFANTEFKTTDYPHIIQVKLYKQHPFTRTTIM